MINFFGVTSGANGELVRTRVLMKIITLFTVIMSSAAAQNAPTDNQSGSLKSNAGGMRELGFQIVTKGSDCADTVLLFAIKEGMVRLRSPTGNLGDLAGSSGSLSAKNNIVTIAIGTGECQIEILVRGVANR
jgi:hypothetical protein